MKRLSSWLASIGYSGGTDPGVIYARITAAPRGTTGADAATHSVTTQSYIAVLRTLNTQISTLAASIAEQLDVHPDAKIFTSLPRSGSVRAARLLAEIGDARGRFPTASSLACLAGVAPSTRQSGKVTAVTFRWGADKELRHALCDFAGDSRHSNPWAADLYAKARARKCDHRMPSASWPALGRPSSGVAGRPTRPTTPPSTAASNASSTKINKPWRLDTGQLIGHAPYATSAAAGTSPAPR